MAGMISFLTPAAAAAPLPSSAVDATYQRLRVQVFLSIFVGYAAYYLVRKNYSLVMPDVQALYPQHSKAALGAGLTAVSVAYGFSKFLMGSISDQSNPRFFMPLGLLLSCLITAFCGLEKGIYASIPLIVILQALNGWFNGLGWAPCGKTMVHWCSQLPAKTVGDHYCGGVAPFDRLDAHRGISGDGEFYDMRTFIGLNWG